MLSVAESEVRAEDGGACFDLLGGSVEFGRGVRIRTMVRARGEVRPFADGSVVNVRFWPHWEAIAWLSFTSLLALVGFIALITSLLTGAGPLLWPFGATALFGAITARKVHQLRVARRDLESDLVAWLKH